MHYKALFLDIDGTIVRPDDSIEESTKKAILDVQSKGIEVFLSTGRPVHEIAGLAKELNIQSFIGYNGASAMINGRSIFHCPMNRNHVEKLVQIASEQDHQMVLHTSKTNCFTHLDSSITQKFMEQFNYTKNEKFNPTNGQLDDIMSVTLINVKGSTIDLYDNFPNLSFSQLNVEGMQHCYDVIRDNVNKGTGVRMVLDHLNIPKESAIAFGDGLNDKEMLSCVGESFAMGNAHPDLFHFAKHQTTDVMDSGIYNGLKMIGLVE